MSDKEDAPVVVRETSGKSILGPRGKSAARWLGGRDPNPKPAGALASFVRPIGYAVGLLLIGYFAFSWWNIYSASEQRRKAHLTVEHVDGSKFALAFGSVAGDDIEFHYRKVDGAVLRVVASRADTEAFVSERLQYLAQRRDQVAANVDRDVDALFARVFEDRERAVDEYANWFFEWGRSWTLLWKAAKGAVEEIPRAGLSRSAVSEAANQAVAIYLVKHYTEKVLKPGVRGPEIRAGVNKIMQNAHREFLATLAEMDTRFQRFVSRGTVHAVPLKGDAVSVQLDWDAQKWKTPKLVADDAGGEAMVSIATVTAGVLAGPAIETVLLPIFAELALSIVGSIEIGLYGSVLGTLWVPGLGTVVGGAAGVGADYLVSLVRESLKRENFVRDNRRAINATEKEWREKVRPVLRKGVSVWFDDSQAAIVKG